MTTFFTILFILFVINALIMIFSLNEVRQKTKELRKNVSQSSSSKIYPINFITSKYNKAV